MAFWICFSFFGLLLALVLAHEHLGWSIPAYSVLTPALLLLTATSYLFVLREGILKGEVYIPARVLRCYNPALFWAAVVVQFFLVTATGVGAALSLLSAH